ncbi:VIT and vWA domain-containing protein [Catenovulum maritimum]|uniref:VWFA domain-containing protein n=1 Tax=Catenovulum maritimum TaxID=1513271 RepID=A0A0J8GZ66_9ALTE|nr:VIT and VWA domain-containing protein [Catenovulum maritimum]KMT66008.1 hypothetical protein XM47_06030 [Catenovulum maritimum]
MNILRIAVLSLISLFAISSAQAAGLIKPTNSQLPELELTEHKVDIQVFDNLAVVSIEQTFFNPSQQDLEAIYQFPVPNYAAVGQFSWWLNGQEIQAEVVKKEQAKQIYQKQKAAGKNAALVEQNKFYDFKIKLTQVLAQQDAKIKLVYIQKLKADHGIFELNYALENGGTDEVANAFWSRNDKVTQLFSFNLNLHSSYPIDSFRLPKHPQANIQQISEQEWQVSFTNSGVEGGQSFSLNQDILAYWRLADNAPAGLNLISYKTQNANQGTFMLTLTPGNDLQPINQGSDWTFVLDKSGSMQGKWHSLLAGVEIAINKMPANNRVRILMFDNNTKDITNGYVQLDAEGKQQLIAAMQNYAPSDGTNLYKAVRESVSGIDRDRTSGIVLVTDGVATVGEKSERKLMALLDKKDIRLFTFIMGNNANAPLLEHLAKQSNGFAQTISNSDDIVGKVMLAASKVSHTAMHDIEIKIKGGKVINLNPAEIQSLYRGEQLTLFGQYHKAEQVELIVSAKVSGKPIRYQAKFDLPSESTQYPEIERLSAYAQILDIEEKQRRFGKTDDATQAITDIALEYGLVTDYTSMLLLTEAEYEDLGIQRKNAQRVKLESQARETRKNIQPSSNHISGSEQNFGGARATTSNSSGSGSGGGSISILLVLCFGVIKFVRVC